MANELERVAAAGSKKSHSFDYISFQQELSKTA
jgi:hypothetical protein